jgi:parvulin-like peptidyl-prolyl isomerase
MKPFFLFSFLLSLQSTAQNIEAVRRELASVKTVKDAERYVSRQPKVMYNIAELLSHKEDSTGLFVKIFNSEVGMVIEDEAPDTSSHVLIKVLEIKEFPVMRAQYIYLDASLGVQRIDSLRKVILKRAAGGERFSRLAAEYSMDDNSRNGGDMGWFEEGYLVKDFENSLTLRKAGEVYTLDIPSMNWYYVIKKTHEPKMGRKVIALFVQVILK